MALAAQKKRDRLLISSPSIPTIGEVLDDLSEGRELDITTLPTTRCRVICAPRWPTIAAQLDENTAAVIIQYPNFYGGIEDVAALAEAVHAAGALLIVATLPVPLGCSSLRANSAPIS